MFSGAMMTACAIVDNARKQNRNSAVGRWRQRGGVNWAFILLSGSLVFVLVVTEKNFNLRRWTPPPDWPGAGTTHPFCPCVQGCFQAADKHTQSFVNCRPITWPRFRTSPASAGRLDCLHPLHKKSPGHYYSVRKILLAERNPRRILSIRCQDPRQRATALSPSNNLPSALPPPIKFRIHF